MRLLWFVPFALVLSTGCRTNESPKAQVDDLQIMAKVKSKLASDVGLSSVTDISINSTNGVVTLSGQVDSVDQKMKAEVAARSVPKVSRVINNLQIAKPTQSGTCRDCVTRPPRKLSGAGFARGPGLGGPGSLLG